MELISQIVNEPPNQPAAGNAGIARRLTIQHHWPGVPEPGRFCQETKMNTRSSSLNIARWSSVTAIIGFLAAASAVGDDLPESIASEWKVKTDQIEILWDSQSKILEFRQLASKAVVYGPSNLYELPYEIAFQSAVPDASILLILVADGNPTRISTTTRISTKIRKNESGNPQVYIVNKAGVIVGDWGYINKPN